MSHFTVIDAPFHTLDETFDRRLLMVTARKARAIGFNHVVLEVGDIDQALAFYDRLFAFELRSRSDTDALIDLGDQFLALRGMGARAPGDGHGAGLARGAEADSATYRPD